MHAAMHTLSSHTHTRGKGDEEGRCTRTPNRFVDTAQIRFCGQLLLHGLCVALPLRRSLDGREIENLWNYPSDRGAVAASLVGA